MAVFVLAEVKFIVAPAQIAATAGAEAIGVSLTVTVTVAVEVQPFPSVTVTVYNVVIVGFAVGFAVVVVDKPVAGLHA